jgi:PAS domain S-box-containing protein
LRHSPGQFDGPRSDEANAKRLIYELQVHQVELQMQNEELRQAQEDMAAARDRFRDLFEFAPVGYLTLDLNGVIREANLTLATVLGVPRLALFNARFARFIARESQDSFHRLRQAARSVRQTLHCELALRCAGGAQLPVQFDCLAFDDAASSSVRLHAAVLDITGRKQAEASLAASRAALEQANHKLKQANRELEDRVAARTAKLRALAVELSRVEEKERHRVALALHEGLQQSLFGARMSLTAIAADTIPAEATAVIHKASSWLDEAAQMTRTLAFEISPPALYDVGLAPALRWLERWATDRFGLKVEVDVEETDGAEPEGVRVALFRFASELLTNVARHARVKQAALRLRSPREGELELTVSDNGVGFNPAAARSLEAIPGFGLFSLRERAESLGGQMEILSSPGWGCQVRISIPVARRSEAGAGAPGGGTGRVAARSRGTGDPGK